MAIENESEGDETDVRSEEVEELQMSDSEHNDNDSPEVSESSEDEESVGDVVTLSAGHFDSVEIVTLAVPCNKTVSALIKVLCRKLVKKFSPWGCNLGAFHLWTLKISDPIDDSGLSDNLETRPSEYSNDPFFCTAPESERDPTLSDLDLLVGSRLAFRYDGGHVFARQLTVTAIGPPGASEADSSPDAPLFSKAELDQSHEARWLASRNGPDFTMRWGDDELSVLRLLNLAGLKFSLAWDRFLESVLLCRTRGATSSTKPCPVLALPSPPFAPLPPHHALHFLAPSAPSPNSLSSFIDPSCRALRPSLPELTFTVSFRSLLVQGAAQHRCW